MLCKGRRKLPVLPVSAPPSRRHSKSRTPSPKCGDMGWIQVTLHIAHCTLSTCFYQRISKLTSLWPGVSRDGRLSAPCLCDQWRRFDDGRDWRHNLSALSLRRHQAGRGQVNPNNILYREYNQIFSLEGSAHILPVKWTRLVGVQYGRRHTPLILRIW